jgi:hypothetical protein
LCIPVEVKLVGCSTDPGATINVRNPDLEVVERLGIGDILLPADERCVGREEQAVGASLVDGLGIVGEHLVRLLLAKTGG